MLPLTLHQQSDILYPQGNVCEVNGVKMSANFSTNEPLHLHAHETCTSLMPVWLHDHILFLQPLMHSGSSTHRGFQLFGEILW
jgi:hypothetical protein